MRLPLVIAAGLVACGPAEDPPPARNAVLITLDTTRADALGAYGCSLPITPHLDRLAREGVVFERARTVAPLTAPAHASMMTGLYPPRHGVRVNGGSALSSAAETLAERASAAGIETAAFLAAVVLDRGTGLAQGFGTYDETPRGLELTSVFGQRPATDVIDAALRWLAARDPERRFLLWVHLFDPHSPYAPPPRFLERAQGNAYLGEVAFMDHEVGRLLGRLDLAQTAVMVVGDHGEDLMEHGEPTHAVYCYDSTIRVPFLLRRPDGARAGERSEHVVSVVDVAPTLAEALGLGSVDGGDGRSLWSGAAPERSGVYFESYHSFLNYGWSPLVGWADAEAKYLHSSEPELYLLEAAAPERDNRVADEGARAAAAREEIARVVGAPALAGGEEVDAAALRGLEQLGYTTAGVGARDLLDPLAPTTLPAPASRRAELAEFLRAQELSDQGRDLEAARILEQIVDANPRNVAALDELGASLARIERWDDAIAVLERALVLAPDRVALHANLALASEATGDLESAVRHGRRALELDPDHGMAQLNLERVLGKLGQ